MSGRKSRTGTELGLRKMPVSRAIRKLTIYFRIADHTEAIHEHCRVEKDLWKSSNLSQIWKALRYRGSSRARVGNRQKCSACAPGTGASCVRATVRAKGAERVQIYQAHASFASG